MILRDLGCEVSTVATVLEFSSPFATLLNRYVDRSSNYSIYRNTADLPTVSIKAISYFTFYISTFEHTRDIQYRTGHAQVKSHKPIYELKAALSRRFACVCVVM
jgi:hypothetical protein